MTDRACYVIWSPKTPTTGTEQPQNIFVIYLISVDGVNKGDLSESLRTDCTGDLPAWVNAIVNHLDRVALFICFVLYIQIHIVFEVLDLKRNTYQCWNYLSKRISYSAITSWLFRRLRSSQSPIVGIQMTPIFSCCCSFSYWFCFFLPIQFVECLLADTVWYSSIHQYVLTPIQMHYAVSDVVLQQEAHV